MCDHVCLFIQSKCEADQQLVICVKKIQVDAQTKVDLGKHSKMYHSDLSLTSQDWELGFMVGGWPEFLCHFVAQIRDLLSCCQIISSCLVGLIYMHVYNMHTILWTCILPLGLRKPQNFCAPGCVFPHQEAEDLKEISFKSSIREQKLMDMKHLEVPWRHLGGA